MVFKTRSRIKGKHTDPESQKVGRAMENLENTKLGSVQGKPSRMYSIGKYEEGDEKGYRSVMTNT